MSWSDLGKWWGKMRSLRPELSLAKMYPREETEVVALMNQKGGCGKTTTAVNLSAALADQGFEVLLLDLDPQAHATISLGLKSEEARHTVYDVLVREDVSLDTVLVRHGDPVFHLSPSSSVLSSALVDLLEMENRERVLRERLKAVENRFDYIFIDCPPALSILTLNALTAARWVIVPVQPHFLAIDGLRELLDSIDLVRERFNPALEILGILPTLFDRRLRVGSSILEGLRSCFNDEMFETVIRYSTPLVEASMYGKPVIRYSPHSVGAQDYMCLAKEVVHRGRRRKRAGNGRKPAERRAEGTAEGRDERAVERAAEGVAAGNHCVAL